MSYGLGILSVAGIVALVYLTATTLDSKNRLPERQQIPSNELALQRKHQMQMLMELKRRDTEKLVDRMHRKYLKNPEAEMNFLVISGGGENGAFGSGFLIGWSSVPEESAAMPVFDGVTGVSAGSLIAPFAFIGTTDSLNYIDTFFRNPTEDFVVLRRPLYFLPQNMSLASVPGLERAVGQAFTVPIARQIVKHAQAGRLLLIQSTNLDLACPEIFNFVDAAKESIDQNNSRPMEEIVLASAALPGMFPPREIDGALYVDGGVEGNFYYGGHPSKPENTFGGIWMRKFPHIPIPKTYYWVIINGNLRELPKTSDEGWASIASRSLAISAGSDQVVALRELYSIAELTQLRGLGDVNVRWVAVEEQLPDGNFPDIFNQHEMRRLSDLGKRLGRDPKSWNSSSP